MPNTSVPQYKSPLVEAIELSEEMRVACDNRDARAVAAVMPRIRANVQRMKSQYHDRPDFIVEMAKRFEDLERSAKGITEHVLDEHQV